jgi:hypothetical protein
MSTNWTAGEGGELAEEVGDEHGLAEPGQPRDDHAGGLGRADEDRVGVLGPAQPPRVQSCGCHAGQVDPGQSQERIAVQAPQPDQPRLLLLGPDTDAAPGVGQIAGGALVVGQTSPGDGGHRRGDALVVEDELGGWEAVLAGPLVPVAEAQGLGEQGPLGR